MILINNLILNYVDLLTPNHIKQYASSKHIYVSDKECEILCDFIKNNSKELLVDENVLLKLKPKIRNSLYSEIVILYQKNKAKL